jgi:hypothetical protein
VITLAAGPDHSPASPHAVAQEQQVLRAENCIEDKSPAR